MVVDVREYIDTAGRSPFRKWLDALNVQAAAQVATALERIAAGNLSNVKTAASGVLGFKIDFGPGYRIYFGRDSDRVLFCTPVPTRSASGRISARQRRIGT